MTEFFKLHATMYVQHVLYTLKKKLVFFYYEKKFSLDFVESSRRALYIFLQNGHNVRTI